MADESFDDLEIARVLNQGYVAIKVDREERPDVDGVYMAAVQRMSGRGGWPMTVWLTPDGEPFYGGTYFPARDGDRGAKRGFLTLLKQIGDAWRNDPDGMTARARELTARTRRAVRHDGGGERPGGEAAEWVVAGFAERFDETYGGLRGKPKFPGSLPLGLLAQRAAAGDEHALTMLERTLDGMAAGGIRDRIGGGFHRYTVDERWRIPHFEKMLYDNALLAGAYVDGWRLTGREGLRDVAVETLAFMDREFGRPDGGFASALDAVSDDENGQSIEGRYYTWTPAEVRAVCDDGPLAIAWLGLDAEAELDGRHVPWQAASVDALAERFETNRDDVVVRLAGAADAPRRAREARAAPGLDSKVIAGWNGLAIGALARAGFAFDDDALLARAERAAEAILTTLLVDGRLHRSIAADRLGPYAVLDDHVYLIGGLLDLFEATGELRWFDAALALQREQDRRFAAEDGGYWRTAGDAERLIAREKTVVGGALPAANAIAARNALRLAELTGQDDWRRRAAASFDAFGGTLQRSPTAAAELVAALALYEAGMPEVVVVTSADDPGASLLSVLRRSPRPRVQIVVGDAAIGVVAERLPIVRGKRARDGRATAYVCEGGACRLPVDDAGALAALLDEIGNRAKPEKTGAKRSSGD